MAIRFGLVKEVIVMAFDTVRTNKMRSGLTVLGVVIGITSIVGMTAMIRGFDQSVRDMMSTIGPEHDLRPAVRHRQLQRRRRDPGAAEAAEPDGVRRPRDRGTGDHDCPRRHSARQRRPRHAVSAGLLPRAEDQGGRRLRDDREFRRRHAHPVRRGPVFQRHRGAVPQERLRPRQHGVPAAVCHRRHRSDREVRAHRQRAVRGRGRVRQASDGRRLQPRRGRFRRDPLHVVSARLRAPRGAREQDRDVLADSDRGDPARRRHPEGRRWPTSSA